MSDRGLAPVRRPLTDRERELLVWLIDHGTHQGSPQLHAQVQRLSVRERCTCGCPTVYFALDDMPVPRKGERLVSDHLAIVDGMDVGVMLFEDRWRSQFLGGVFLPRNQRTFGRPEVASIRSIPAPLGGEPTGKTFD